MDYTEVSKEAYDEAVGLFTKINKLGYRHIVDENNDIVIDTRELSIVGYSFGVGGYHLRNDKLYWVSDIYRSISKTIEGERNV